MSVVEVLAQQLCARRNTATVIPFEERIIGQWRPEMNDCHRNVDLWVLGNPGHKAVRGWMVFDYAASSRGLLPVVDFMAHSIVQGPDGELFDITPSNASQRYPFLVHDGTEEDFIELVEGQQMVRIRHHVG